MLPLPRHPAPWGTPSLAIWANLTSTVLQTNANRFWLILMHFGPEVVLDIFIFRPNSSLLLHRGLALTPYNLVMIAAANSEIWG
jgi:hypothetical protein